MERISAGVISRLCATITECRPPSISRFQKSRNFRSAGNFGKRSYSCQMKILQQMRVIRHVVENVGRRQPIALKLATEIGIDHEILRLDWSVCHRRAPLPLRKS